MDNGNLVNKGYTWCLLTYIPEIYSQYFETTYVLLFFDITTFWWQNDQGFIHILYALSWYIHQMCTKITVYMKLMFVTPCFPDAVPQANKYAVVLRNSLSFKYSLWRRRRCSGVANPFPLGPLCHCDLCDMAPLGTSQLFFFNLLISFVGIFINQCWHLHTFHSF